MFCLLRENQIKPNKEIYILDWSRADVKSRAKSTISHNYWKTVFVSLLMLIFTDGTIIQVCASLDDELRKIAKGVIAQEYEYGRLDIKVVIVLIILGVSALLVFLLANFLLDVFMKNPLEVGTKRFMVKTASALTADENGMIADIAYAFDHNYTNVVKVLFFKDLYCALWSLLLVVPGIYKRYQYRMVAYILGENPSISREKAFSISKEMMKGQIWKMFLFDLSFIPWHILGTCTIGIAEVLYVQPYVNIAKANLYREIREIYYLNKEMEEYKNELHNLNS